MTQAARRVAELDEQLKLIERTKADLDRLASFLKQQRAALVNEARAAMPFLGGVTVSKAELDEQIKRATDLVGQLGGSINPNGRKW